MFQKPHQMRLFLKTAILCFASRCSLVLIEHTMDFLNRTDVCAQATPLIAFLTGWKLGPHPINREHALQD